jgi:predicted  nucleic acid-binding Zn-ribbon protein
MKNQIENLVKLQKVEIEYDRIASRLNDVSNRFEALDAGIRELRQVIDKEATQIRELKKKYREHESDVQVNISRIKKSQVKLNAVKTNREYQSMLKEIEKLKAMNSQIEDEMLECLELTERIEKGISARESEFKTCSGQVEIEKEDILRETEQGKKKLAQLDAELKEYYSMIEPGLLKRFIKIKEQNAGKIAIVPVKDAVCQGCNLNLPPQMYNELYLGNALKFCPNCQRIIYLEKSISDT